MENRSAEIERTTERMKKQSASKEAIIAAVERINKKSAAKPKKKKTK